MDLLRSYSDEDPSPSPSPPRILPSKSAAPTVDDTMLALTVTGSDSKPKPLDPTQHQVTFNPTYDQLWAPIYGPAHPFTKDGLAQGLRNHKLGFVEDASIQPFVFDEQYNTFHKFGYAADPSATHYIGDLDTMEKNNAVSVYNIPRYEQKRRKLEKKKEKMDAIHRDKDGDDEEEVDNASTDAWLVKNSKSPWSGKREGVEEELTDEQKRYAEEHAKKKGEKEAGHEKEKGDVVAEKSTFHGKEEKDYQGRSWIAPPKDAKANNDHCYIP